MKDFADACILLWTTVPNHATEDANHCIETYARSRPEKDRPPKDTAAGAIASENEGGQREGINAMIEAMVTVRITEAELARDIHAVLARVRDEGVELIVEQDHRPVAVIKTPQSPGRKISECIALAKAYEDRLGHTPVPDADFAGDVQAAVNAHREPLNPPSWD